MKRTQTVVAVACLVVGCGWLYAGGRSEAVQQGGMVSDNALPGWEYNTLDVSYSGQNGPGSVGMLLSGPACVHRLLITPQFANSSSWTFYDGTKIDASARKIATFIVPAGQTFQMTLDVRVRHGLICSVSNTSASATVLFQAD